VSTPPCFFLPRDVTHIIIIIKRKEENKKKIGIVCKIEKEKKRKKDFGSSSLIKNKSNKDAKSKDK
jgi:hypothetical protein